MSEYGLISGQLSGLNWGSFFTANEFPVTLGNIVGGVFIIGVMVYLAQKQGLETK